MEAGFELKELGPDYDFIMLGGPRVFSGFPTITFLAPENIKRDVNVDDLVGLEIEDGHGAFFVIIPENSDALPLIENLFPGGQISEVQRITTANEVLYYSYVLEAE
jgi:hypothetical protein